MSLKIRFKMKGGETRDKLLLLNKQPEYKDGRTSNAFKDQCDINKMLAKAQKVGSIEHLIKYPEATYGDFDGEFDLLTAHNRIERAQQIFDDLPSEIRKIGRAHV